VEEEKHLLGSDRLKKVLFLMDFIKIKRKNIFLLKIVGVKDIIYKNTKV